ncbi:MAG: hypothetical protein Q8N63_02545 [Nanoarchaeota archaeon]|nr:hypothetical protein [Nanoarchaeota archaeon]
MVHKKYIKRNGKVFGPYLYQNYRENGITKTRYLGIAKERKKMQVNLLWIIGVIVLIVLLMAGGIFFLGIAAERGSGFAGELASKSPFDFLTKLFTTSSPVNVFVQIVGNVPPEFLTRPSEILVCEDNAVDEKILVEDADGDILDLLFSPGTGFALFFNPNPALGEVLTNVTLYTRILNWKDIKNSRAGSNGWAIYPKTVSVRDDSEASDYFSTNITIIEVNNPPEFNIGVSTIDLIKLYLKGEETNLYYDLGSELILNGEETSKQDLIYNLTYQNGSISPFNISSLGVINISGNESYILSGNFTNYPLKVCVNDTSLLALGRILHNNISLCWNYGLNQDAKKYCDNFTLTITKENRPPKITSYNPLNISFHESTNESFNRTLIVGGTDILYFNLTAEDSDWTPLDVYWYVDNVSKGYYKGLEKNNVSKFDYLFGCGISGYHLVRAIVTDGLLNDSVTWNVTVKYTDCPSGGDGGGGGGGGGGGKLYCKEKWGCDEWMQCENLYELIEKGWPGKDIELLIKERCDLLNYTKEFCGFQNRICTDFNYCKTGFEKPPFIKECYYTKNPNCTDNIRNCHNGSCEVLTDCGGPCEACPTCNDKIQNQGETKIDCGGPCKTCIELPWLPVAFKSIITYSLIALLIIVLLLVARQIIKYTKFKRVFGESRIKNALIRGVANRDEDKNIISVVMSLFFIFFVIVLLFFANVYIINLGQANKIVSSASDIGAGFLASYGFINSIFSNFGMFLNMLPYFTVPSGTITQGYEDTILTYDFKNNVTDPDLGDIPTLTFKFDKINDAENFTDYPWINLTSDGVLTINATNEFQIGNFKLSVKVLDQSNDGQIMSFYFNISPVNDAPQFVNLTNQTLDAEDLFEYIIDVEDEENNVPFKFNVIFVSCSNELERGNCTLFSYISDEIDGRIDISFIPTNKDIGSYIINFSVMDSSSLGNKTTSQLVNFTVTPALWNSSIQLNYLLVEDENKFINLSEDILEAYRGNVVFSYILNNSEFPSFNSFFNLTTGIINITPEDKDVGYNLVEITASSGEVSSSRIFNFSILNIEDAPIIQPWANLTIIAYENEEVNLYLYVKDDDFFIPQKSFYDENLTLNLTIYGPIFNLFNFSEAGIGSGTSIMSYLGSFTPRAGDIGEYNITINVSDKTNLSDALEFNLTIRNQSYDTPNITFPDETSEFYLKEGFEYNLTFNANHFVGDDLTYEFYIDGILRNNALGPGNGANFTWRFTPNFTEETYGNKVNLTLFVVNPHYPKFNASRTWNLTINHTNAPPVQIDEIGDMGPATYGFEFYLDLMKYFYDADFYDAHYNNTPEGILDFKAVSNLSSTKINQRVVNNFIYFSASTATRELLTINVSDNASSVLSNNFTITFFPPIYEPVPTPSGGGSETVPIALKIIVPGQISAYEGETIKIPIKLVNSGGKDFNDLNLNSSAFKNGSLFNELKTSLDKTYFKVLKPKQEENLTLTVFFNKSKLGNYEILVQATSKSPKYTDWGKIHINLQAINESQVRELLVFTEELIAGNPQCLEIKEIIEEANRYYQAGNYADARIKANEALNSCRDTISQVSVSEEVGFIDFIRYLKLSSYLFLAIIGAIALAIILGLIYYFIKRREIAKLQKTVQEAKEEYTKV